MNKELTKSQIDNNRIKKLRYQSWHRGWKETDILLGNFADKNLESFTEQEIDIYEKLIEESDADIWDWLVGKEPVDNPAYTEILQKIRSGFSNTN